MPENGVALKIQAAAGGCTRRKHGCGQVLADLCIDAAFQIAEKLVDWSIAAVGASLLRSRLQGLLNGLFASILLILNGEHMAAVTSSVEAGAFESEVWQWICQCWHD